MAHAAQRVRTTESAATWERTGTLKNVGLAWQVGGDQNSRVPALSKRLALGDIEYLYAPFFILILTVTTCEFDVVHQLLIGQVGRGSYLDVIPVFAVARRPRRILLVRPKSLRRESKGSLHLDYVLYFRKLMCPRSRVLCSPFS